MKRVGVIVLVLLGVVVLIYWWRAPSGHEARSHREAANRSAPSDDPLAHSPPEGGSTADGTSEPTDSVASDAASESSTIERPLLTGTVLGHDDFPVSAAIVQLFPRGEPRPELHDETHQLVVDDHGEFDSGDRDAGHYSLIVRSEGYRLRVIDDLRLDVERPRRITVRLVRGLDIAGVVFDPGGLPVSDATITLSPAPEVSELTAHNGGVASVRILTGDGGATAHLAATSDSNGEFRVTGVSPGKYVVSAFDAAWPVAHVQPVVAGTEGVELRFHRGGGLAGRVFDPDGDPVPGALVTVSGNERRNTTTDLSGRFRIEGLEAGSVWLLIDHPGYPTFRPTPTPTIIAGEVTPELVFTLERGATVEGVVVRGNGEPTAAARVRVFGDIDLAAEERTAPDGSFAVEGLAMTNELLRVVITADGHLPWLRSFPTGPTTVQLGRVTLDAGYSIEGTVVDPEGSAVANAAIETTPTTEEAAFLDPRLPTPGLDRTVRTRSGGDGRFRLGPVPSGTNLLAVVASGFATREQTVEIGDRDRVGVVVELGAGHRFTARLVDDEGFSIPGASVDVRGATRSRATSDEAGEVALVGLAEEYTVTIRADGHLEWRERYHGDVETVATLSRTATLGGAVRAGDSRRPIPEFTVIVRSPVATGSTGRTQRVPFVDLEGLFEVPGLAAGEIALRIEAVGYAPRSLPAVELLPGATKDLDVVLDRGRTLRGLVTTTEGLPIRGVSIDIIHPDAPRAHLERPQMATVLMGRGEYHAIPMAPRAPTAVTNEDGTFEITHAPSGRVQLTFFSLDHVEQQIETDRSEIHVRLAAGAAFEGTVKFPDGSPCVGGLIGIRALGNDDFRPRLPVSIGPNGEYAIRGLPSGEYEFEPRSLLAADDEDGFRHSELKLSSVVVRVREARTARRDLVFPIRP